MRKLTALLIVLSLTVDQEAYAWGRDGHRIVCGLAEEQLNPAAKKMVERLLIQGKQLKGGMVSFPDACLWPDDVKHSTRKSTYEHHFINVPDDAMEIDLGRDCAAANCIAVGVQQALTYLSTRPDGNRASKRQAAALRFLGHYIADLHQPLHIGNASDWGGNRIKVRLDSKETNLHALWDYGLPERFNLNYPESIGFLLTVKHRTADGTVLSWMNESLELARTHAYMDTTGEPIKNGHVISPEYLDRNKPIIIRRLTLAGARLARLLNDIADGGQPAVFRFASIDN